MHRTTYGNALICLPAGTRALALPLLEAILAEYPNEQLAHCTDTQDYFQEKVDNWRIAGPIATHGYKETSTLACWPLRLAPVCWS